MTETPWSRSPQVLGAVTGVAAVLLAFLVTTDLDPTVRYGTMAVLVLVVVVAVHRLAVLHRSR